MTISTRTRLLAGIAISLAAASLAFGQDTTTVDTDARRLRALELQVSNLENLLRARTDTPGPQDRVNRDFNVDTRLDQLDRRVQQIENEIMNLQRQVQDAQRAASQAQSEAMSAAQAARDAASRVPF